MPLNNNWYAIADCTENGELKPEYCLIKKLHFYASESMAQPCFVFTCSCKDSLAQSNRLISISSVISESSQAFKSREKAQYCIHRVALSKLRGNENPNSSPIEQEDDESEQVAVLSFDPLCIAVITGIIDVC